MSTWGSKTVSLFNIDFNYKVGLDDDGRVSYTPSYNLYVSVLGREFDGSFQPDRRRRSFCRGKGYLGVAHVGWFDWCADTLGATRYSNDYDERREASDRAYGIYDTQMDKQPWLFRKLSRVLDSVSS